MAPETEPFLLWQILGREVPVNPEGIRLARHAHPLVEGSGTHSL